MIEIIAQPAQKTEPSQPLSSPRSEAIAMEEDMQFRMDREVLSYFGAKKQFKKGDVVVSEGDLYQRLYIVSEGSLEVTRNNEVVREIPQGESFGYATISFIYRAVN